MLLQAMKVRNTIKKKKSDRKGMVKGKSSIRQRRGFLGPLLSLGKELQLMWVYFQEI